MDIYGAIGDPRRRKIIEQLSQPEVAETGLSIKELTVNTNISRQAITKHLNILVANDIVSAKFSGKERLHSLNPEQLKILVAWLTPIAEQWNQRFDDMKANLNGKHSDS